MDKRLTQRYDRLVMEHLNSSERLSAGLKALPDNISSFASTQAAWRFYNNEAVSLQTLQEPLMCAAHEGVASYCDDYALCIHDWSRLSYKHANKTDTYAITHATDVGYDLQTSLLISDQAGQPLAPVAQRLVSANGSYATYYSTSAPATPVRTHLDEVSQCIDHLEQQAFEKPLVHIIDREGDSVAHMRHWQSLGTHWLIRARDNPRIDYNDQPMACKTIGNQLAYTQARQVNHQGKRVWQWVGEAEVSVSRPAKPSRKKGYKPMKWGEPVTARLVVSRLINDQGDLVAEWLLLSNRSGVSGATLALWYYWRWRIESFFKLLKSAGHELEHWQQESALAIAKRLLVVSMACVTVWAIAADTRPEVAELRAFLIKLSGRQLPPDKPFTHSALLAGLWVFLSLFEVIGAYSSQELDGFKITAQRFLGGSIV